MICKIGRKKIEYKILTPSDFLEDKEGVNFSFIKYEIGKDIYSQVMEECKTKEENLEQVRNLYKNIVNKAAYLTEDEIDNLSDDDIYNLFIKIVVASLKIFQDVKKINKATALYYDNLAQRYGKTPIEIMCPLGNYTELDAYFFNNFCCYVGQELEHDLNLQARAKQMLKGK